VHTGQILALAIRPTFNPNQFRHTTPALLRDHAVSDVYEPGSTFKLVTYSAAIDAKVAAPDDMIDCQGGKITIFGRTIHDNQGEHLGVVPLHKALEESSDVAAVKLAMKLGPDRFYQYIRDFGFGTRSNVELPGETRGLLRPVGRWQPSSIGSLAIGQEVAVTPLQLVTMVSTIANGGIYLQPHVIMPDQANVSDGSKQKAGPQINNSPQAVHAAESHATVLPGDLPNPLPDGSHRVISTTAAAEMRKMMEGVVLFGTGKPAQVNGYSSGGKTGNAQKIDPATHTYSKTMHIASFAGFAPVNNPVIAVAVVMDSPKGDYYGTAVSAPIFADVAQQVLEYLGVPHDIDLQPSKVSSKKEAPIKEDEASSDAGDINALYAAANDLPSDDPLRDVPAPASAMTSQPANVATSPSTEALPSNSSAAAQQAVRSRTNSAPTPNTVVIANAGQFRVPSLIGLPLRQVIEQAGMAGLEVEIAGNGTAREQAPAPGTFVSPGTKVVVRCER